MATVGGNAVASYHSAALLHHLSLLTSPPAGTVTLTLARKWNRAQPADVVFHASELPPEHVTKLYNLPVTTVARTVADLARTLPFMDAVVVADSALSQEKTTKPELEQILKQFATGWPGVRQARRAIEFADERAESPLESAARVVFAEAGLEPPELQVTIHGEQVPFAARVDFLWRAQKVVAEADGLVKYNDRKDLLDERERDHQLREAGYTTVHFTWKEICPRRREAVIARLRHRPRNAKRSNKQQQTQTTQAPALRQSTVGRSASGRTRCEYRLVIENSDSISVSDSRCGSSPRSISAVCFTCQ